MNEERICGPAETKKGGCENSCGKHISLFLLHPLRARSVARKTCKMNESDFQQEQNSFYSRSSEQRLAVMARRLALSKRSSSAY